MASAGIRKTRSGRYKVWWRLDDASQGSQTFDTRDQARDFKHDLLARLARGTWVDPRLGRQTFEAWAREWWEGWSANPDHSLRTLQAAEARLRRHLLPTLGKRQLRAITVSVVRQSQNDLRGKVGYDPVMACRSLLYRILQTAEDDRRIEANPVRKVPAPKPPVDPAALLGRAKRRAYTPEEFGYLLAGTSITSMVCRRMWPSWYGPAGNWAAARNWIACGCGLGRTCWGSVVTGQPRTAATRPPSRSCAGPRSPLPSGAGPATAFPWMPVGDQGAGQDAWGRPEDDQAVIVVASWTYVGSGYQTTGEAWLAASAAARAREARRIAKEELRTTRIAA